MNEIEKPDKPDEQYEESNTSSESEELLELQNELKSTREQYLFARAEMENQRKRIEREIENARKFAIQDFITRLLPVKKAWKKGSIF